MTRRYLLTTVLLLLVTANAQALPPQYTVQTGVGYDDVGGDGDGFVYLTGGVLFSQGLSTNSIIDLQGELSTYNYPDNDDRSGEEVFLQATYSYTPRAGFQVPTYSAGVRLVDEMLSDDNQDATTTSLILSISYRLDDRNNLIGGVKFDDRDAGTDSEITNLFVSFDHRLSPGIIIYTTLNLGDEEFDSGGGAVGGAADVGAKTFVGGHHIPSEGGGGGGGGGNVITESDNTYLTVGASWSLSSANSLDLSVSRQEYDTDAGSVYGEIYSLDFFHRF